MTEKKRGFLGRLWGVLRKPSAKYSLLTLTSVSFVVGILFWGGFRTALDANDSLEFCISCHEMRDNVYQEYKQTIHYQNRSGVRATCPDCHTPHALVPKLMREARASLELWGTFTGSIDTPEKFEANRMRLATNEWARLKDSNSGPCRTCHNWDAMSPELQKQTPYKKHMKAKAEGQTCIDCHKGIAHHLPKEYRDPNEDE